MATKQIQELPLGVVSQTQEFPVQEGGATTKLSLATIRDWIMSGWSAIYDPTNSAKNVYDRANHTGVQAITTVTNALNKTGDTMSGVLLLPAATPTVAEQAATKAYVDAAAGGFPDSPADSAVYGRKDHAWAKALPLAGGTVTGATTFSAGAVIAGGLQVASGGMTVAGTLNAGANAIYGGVGNFSSLSVSGVATVGSSLQCNGAGAFYGLVSVQSGGLNCVYSGVSFQFSDNISWNRINITNSGYPILFGFAGSTYFQMDTGRFAPISSNGTLLGSSSQRWERVYSVQADSVSSDAKLKQDIRPLNEAELAVIPEIRKLVRMYRMKSDTAKLHCGLIAQDMEALFTANGLDITQYAFYEIGDDMIISSDEDGQPVETPTGEQTRSIAYTELLCWMIAATED